MQVPTEIQYSKEHTWIKKLWDGTALIGITDFAQDQLGEIVYAELPAIGASYAIDAVFGSLEALKTTSDLFMPVSGAVTATNGKLKDAPTLVNSDPYGEGWLIAITPNNEQELSQTLSAAQYEQLTA